MVVCGVLDVLCCVGRRLDETTCNRERDAWIALHKKVSLSLWFSLCLSVSVSVSVTWIALNKKVCFLHSLALLLYFH